jgi:hypothetical protein
LPQVAEFASGVWETSKLNGTKLIWLFAIGVFTLFNCGLVTTRMISTTQLLQIGEFASGVRETSKLGGTRLI